MGVQFRVLQSRVMVQNGLAQSLQGRVEVHLGMPGSPHPQGRDWLRIIAQLLCQLVIWRHPEDPVEFAYVLEIVYYLALVGRDGDAMR